MTSAADKAHNTELATATYDAAYRLRATGVDVPADVVASLLDLCEKLARWRWDDPNSSAPPPTREAPHD
jgi:hypothetical protein